MLQFYYSSTTEQPELEPPPSPEPRSVSLFAKNLGYLEKAYQKIKRKS